MEISHIVSDFEKGELMRTGNLNLKVQVEEKKK
jgi:hypothetical protein